MLKVQNRGSSYRIQVQRTKNGKRERKTFSCKERSGIPDMRAKAAAWQAAKDDSISSEITFREAAYQYLELRRPVLSPSTVAGYEKIIRTSINPIENKKICSITQRDLQLLVNGWAEAKLAYKTIANNHGFVHAVLKEFNPGIIIKTRLPQKTVTDLHIPSDAEVRKLLEVVSGTSLEVPVLLAAFGPLRRGEICALDAEDIKDGMVHVHHALVKDAAGAWKKKAPKTKAGDRYIWLPEQVTSKLPKTGPITKLNPDQITQMFGKTIRENGLPHFRFHDLRHYCASIMHALNVPDAYIIQRGGWETDTVMKRVYRHALTEKSTATDRQVNSHFSGLMG